MPKRIKVYGERNTNTNYVSRLIKLNLDVTEVPGVAPPRISRLQRKLPGNEGVKDIYFYLAYSRTLGWKHACVKPLRKLERYKLVDENLAFLTITKNPYSWLLSLHRRPYHQYFDDNPGLETFLQRPWKTLHRDNTAATLESPIELWNIKNRSYLQLDKQHTLNTTTEAIFKHPDQIIAELSRRFSIDRKSAAFVNHEHSTKEKNKDSDYYRDYYLNEKWRDELSSEAIAIINASVDKELMSHFGYDILS